MNTDDKTLLSSNFDPAKETKFVCHGFTESGDKQWVVDMAMALLNYGDYNVIRTDWNEGSLALYSVTTANTRVVGAEISLLIDRLKVRYTGENILEAVVIPTWIALEINYNDPLKQMPILVFNKTIK